MAATENELVLSRTWYMTAKREKRAGREEKDTSGFLCPKGQRYVPYGHMGNVYKCCKMLQNKFGKYNLGTKLPERYAHSRFLEGETQLDSVLEHKRASQQPSITPGYYANSSTRPIQNKNKNKNKSKSKNARQHRGSDGQHQRRTWSIQRRSYDYV